MSRVALSKTFGATGTSDPVEIRGKANVVIRGGAGTVRLERSFDGGSSWIALSKNSDGDAASYSTTADSVAMNGVFEEPEAGVLWRFNCTTYTSGAVVCEIRQ